LPTRSKPSLDALHTKSRDTIALLEAASAPREISTPMALLVVIALSILAALVTVLLRAGAQAGR
jgi:hypothetical protein